MQPLLHARAAIKDPATDVRSWRTHTKKLPSVERPWVAPQFGGEFFFGQKFRENRI
jgi:hypothetical protein